MSGVDHHLEEFFLNFLVYSNNHLGRFGCIGEILKFDTA